MSQMATASPSSQDPLEPGSVAQLVKAIFDNLRRVVHAPDETLLFSVLCLLAEGHILLEDVPGTGKTTLAKILARSTGLTVGRIQFTPDMEPGDITGRRFFNSQEGKYDFHPGSLFANVIVADEINRAAPRTQAVLLEGMQERQVTVGGVSYDLKHPFLVFATQNPNEQVGTYELPEAQLDRFMVKLSLGYPPRESEITMILEQSAPDPLEKAPAVADLRDLRAAIAAVRQVQASKEVAAYTVSLLEATRKDRRVMFGASPRAGVSVMRLAKAYALAGNRSEVSKADVRTVAPIVLAHRLTLVDPTDGDGAQIVRELLDRSPER